jgi:hypothetical protein
MQALDFNRETEALLDYVVKQFQLADEGDRKAMEYLNYLQDYDGDLFETAQVDYMIANVGEPF